MTEDQTALAPLERIYAEKRVTSDPVPLAAIFRTRRDRKRKPPQEPDWVPPAEPQAQPVLLDAIDDPFALEDSQEIEIVDAADLMSEPLPQAQPSAHAPTPPPLPASVMQGDDDEPHPLRALIPEAADAAWAQDAVLAIAARDAHRLRTPATGAWFAEMFTEEYLQSQPVAGDSTLRAELRFLDWALDLQGRQGYLLDLGCGIGRHAVGQAQAGHTVLGIDLSDTMLRYARQLAEHARVEVQFERRDMRDLDADGQYDGAWCMNTSFGFFSDVENLMLLRAIHRALKPGARLVIDVLNRDHALQGLPTRNWWEGDGCLIQEDIEFNAETSRVEVRRYLVFADGRERVYDISIRLFSAHELVQLLTLAGFSVQSLSGSPHTIDAYFGARSERLLLVAQRAANG